MNIYTASEKTELLRKIADASKHVFTIKDKREVSIAENCLIPDKCIKPLGYVVGGLQCEITEIGKNYLEQGIYEKEEIQNHEKEKIDALERENIHLSNEKLKYERSTRWMAIISLSVSIVALVVGAIGLHQKSFDTPLTHPYDSVSSNAGTEKPLSEDSLAKHNHLQKEVHSQCPQSRNDADSQTTALRKTR